MLGYFILGVLASFGALCALWASLGWLLPGVRGAVLVHMGLPTEGVYSRYLWLWGLGFLNCPFVAVSREDGRAWPKEIEICAPEELLPRLRQEWELYYGTGNGDPPGRHQRRGVSEL